MESSENLFLDFNPYTANLFLTFPLPAKHNKGDVT